MYIYFHLKTLIYPFADFLVVGPVAAQSQGNQVDWPPRHHVDIDPWLALKTPPPTPCWVWLMDDMDLKCEILCRTQYLGSVNQQLLHFHF